MTTVKKLIEVAMPIKEISAESVRDKSIRHGHISTLHLWWARRPLPVCRAVVFASLIPDPLDENCPSAFCDAVEIILGSPANPLKEGHTPPDAYIPYKDIPYTAAIDKMEDNARNRLLMFIGKFSDRYSAQGEKTAPKELLTIHSLIKWENKNNDVVLNRARSLIFISHQLLNGVKKTAQELLGEFNSLYEAIKRAETVLYEFPDRHLASPERDALQSNLGSAINAFLDTMPKVFDPFAGGGAIPLEAARLGCKTFGNDINPVAHIIQKGSVEFPQRFGKPALFTKTEFIRIYGQEEFNKLHNEDKISTADGACSVRIENRLAFDVEFFAKKLLYEAEKEIGRYYPADANGSKPIAYYWARVGTCSNPSCRAEVPLLRQFYLANTKSKQVYLKPVITGTNIDFEIARGKYDEDVLKGWTKRGTLECPCCGSITDVKKLKEQSIEGNLKERILAVIFESDDGKAYRLPLEKEIEIVLHIPNAERPTEKMQRNSAGGDTFSWGITLWSQMFSPRQLLAMQTLVAKLNEMKAELNRFEQDYAKAVVTYMGIWIDRIAMNSTSFGLWELSRENLKTPFGRQAIPFIYDFPEGNPFIDSTGSPLSQINYMVKYIYEENVSPFFAFLSNASSGSRHQFAENYITASVTDPPYYDSIAYADLSDFFYVWLKRTLRDEYEINFSTPQTPKADECTALKHHHNGDKEASIKHFENKLAQIFDSIEYQTQDLVSIMFAHQSTDAWTTLCNSILNSRMNITGSWANDTELTTALKTKKAYLSSSVTVSCRPAQRKGIGIFKEVKKAIEKTVEKEVKELYALGFRGADLLTACFGQAVSEFGKYEKVEKLDGSVVTVADLLEMARESAFNALLKGFAGDDFTKFYIGWLQLYGFLESDFDDAAKFSRVGLSINVADLFAKNILIQNGNKQTLATYRERVTEDKNLGLREDSFLIDLVHRAMALFTGGNRNALLTYIKKTALEPESSFWRVVTALCEVLPNGSDDHKQAFGLLTQQATLLRDIRTLQTPIQNATLFDNIE